MEEKTVHLKAFEYWARISGGIRSRPVFQKVADEVGMKAYGTVRDWAAAFNWKERYKVRLARAIEIEAEKTAHIMLRTRENHRQMVHELLDQIQDRIKRKTMILGTVTDVDKLIKLDLELSGDPVRSEKEIIIITAIPQPGTPVSVNPEDRKGTILRMTRALPESPKRTVTDVTDAAESAQPSWEKPKRARPEREKGDTILFPDDE